jgi:mannosyltransferase OCH1-like enzyme
MTALCAAHNRRRRRKLLLPLAVTTILLLALFRSYIEVAVNILFRGPYIAARRSTHMRISAADGFDVSFRAYPAAPGSAPGPNAVDAALPVPPLIHHIMLGRPAAVDAARNASLAAARQACVDMHPGYEFRYWTDATAAAFVREHFPKLFKMWSGYRMTIQKADSLRYMLLYVHGGMAIRTMQWILLTMETGIFLDLDLECLRPLDPLRRFDFVAPAATPMGISNGFLMVAPRHPFMQFVIDNLPRYNVNWFGVPYPTVMFSTGCHYLS